MKTFGPQMNSEFVLSGTRAKTVLLGLKQGLITSSIFYK